MTIRTESSFQKSGRIKELAILFFPILLITFSNSLFLFVEKLLLARLSVQAMEAAVNASYAYHTVQTPCIVLALMAQVCVGRWYGAQEWKSIGPGIWQFIWFSLLSTLITIPFGIIYGKLYFQGTSLEPIVMPYFYFLVSVNFIYPLGAALTCFYLGQGKTRLILLTVIASQFIKICLAYLLIFGWEGWVPAFGLMGGALSTFIAQGALCAVLLSVFLNKKHNKLFNTHKWQFDFKSFIDCISPGFLRASGRVLAVTSWASTAHLMTLRGGDYLLMLSLGGTLFLFLPFLGDAICQAQVTIISNILGAKKYHLLNRAFYSACALVTIIIAFVTIPLILLPLPTFYYLFPATILDPAMIKHLFFGIWLCFIFFTFAYIPISYVLASKDTRFSLFMGAFSWISGYLYMYIVLEIINISASQFWYMLSIMHGSTALLYFWRMKWLQSKLQPINQEIMVQ